MGQDKKLQKDNCVKAATSQWKEEKTEVETRNKSERQKERERETVVCLILRALTWTSYSWMLVSL